MSDIFRDLEHEWHAIEHGAADWFARHARHDTTPSHYGDTITAGPPPATGAPMSLKTILDEGKTLLDDAESKVHQFLGEHVPQLSSLAELIESNPIFTSVEGALHVPKPILDGFAKALDDLAAAYPKPGDAPAAPAVASDPQPAEQVN